jgi:hypothetical protein
LEELKMKNPQMLVEVMRIVNDLHEHEEATTEIVDAATLAMNILIDFGYNVRSYDADGVIVIVDLDGEIEEEDK